MVRVSSNIVVEGCRPFQPIQLLMKAHTILGAHMLLNYIDRWSPNEHDVVVGRAPDIVQ